MARHGLCVVGVMGNNGIWALEHHPMKFLDGGRLGRGLSCLPATRYDQMVESLGCEGTKNVSPRSFDRRSSGPSVWGGRHW